ncbi:C4-dicarboxylate TRAP transporter substrate-binding protein [Anaerotruncus rubiinfantis]|uniref:C4-dicarboxylate TRAP transporter substrate-binding protein n=1 Tax=Anaerotruncus rubiinfantis TaxID=1720200 RepID=UPI00082FCB60|nr:C4-dicarboxylate TRAP transporter substrate-binding protein [Anaerotruncus rubiinfantis]
MKKTLAILLSALMLVTLIVGCGGSDAAPSSSAAPAAPAAPAASSEAAPAAPEVTLSIGYENNPGETIDLAANEWKRLLEERSGGTMKVELYPSSQLGSKNDLVDQMIAGDSVITLGDGGMFADRGVPDFSISVAYGVFDTWDQVWKLVDSDWFAEQSKQLEEKVGLKILAANWIYGERHILSTKPVRSLADMKGLKIRVPTANMHVVAFQLMDASSVSMNLGEVYTALQQGVIDALENPLSVLYNGKYQEVAKYLTLDGHSKATTTWFCGTTFYNSLTPEQQQWLCETAEEAGLFNNDLALASDAEMIEKFKAEGVEIIELTDAEKAEFLAPMKELFQSSEIAKTVSPGLYDTVMGIING